MKIYTKTGDDGTTGLFFGGRVSKADLGPEAYGTVDELVSALGVARSLATGEVAETILVIQRQLFAAAAELATAPANHHKLQDGVSRVHAAMVEELERGIDAIEERSGQPTEFVVPGNDPVAAAIDVARTVARRAERRVVEHARAGGLPETSLVVPYLNRLADHLYMLARSVEGDWTPSRTEE